MRSKVFKVAGNLWGIGLLSVLMAIVLWSCNRSGPPVLVDGILQLNDRNIDKTIKSSSGYLLVHFSSNDSNCGYCINSNDYILVVLHEYANAPRLARITWEPWYKADEISPKVYKDYWIRGLPMFVLYNNGEEVWRGGGHSDASYTELTQELDICCL